MKKDRILRILMLLFSAGALISAYLYYSKVVNVPVICPNSGCDIVADSPYAYLLGLPVALWGTLYFLGMFVITILNIKSPTYLLRNLLGIGIGWGTLFTIYLRYVEFFKIGAICVWCWGSVAVIALSVYYYYRLLKLEKNIGHSEKVTE